MAFRTERKLALDDGNISIHGSAYLKFAVVTADYCAVYDFWEGIKGRKVNLKREHLEALLAAMTECEVEDAKRAPEDARQMAADLAF